MTSSLRHRQHTLDKIEQDIHGLTQALEALSPSNDLHARHRLAQLHQQLEALWQEVDQRGGHLAHVTEAPRQAAMHYVRSHPWTCTALAAGVLGLVGYFTYQRGRR